MSRWTDKILDEFAGHVRNEVKMLVGQVKWLADNYDCEIPERFDGEHEDAVLEASLCTSAYSTIFCGTGEGTTTSRPRTG